MLPNKIVKTSLSTITSNIRNDIGGKPDISYCGFTECGEEFSVGSYSAAPEELQTLLDICGVDSFDEANKIAQTGELMLTFKTELCSDGRVVFSEVLNPHTNQWFNFIKKE